MMIRTTLLLAALGGATAFAQEAPAPGIVLDPWLGCVLEQPAPPLAEAPPRTAVPQDRYPDLAKRHRLTGRASYYSAFFDGRKTANGEIYRNSRPSAAHLTLPLGTWVEVRSIATGRKIRLRVNDRGPYSGGFVLDLSRAAARALGVDRAPDRRVEIKVLALPGDELLPEEKLESAERQEPVGEAQAEGSVAQNVDP